MPIDTMKNFLALSDRIASAGQPTEEELTEAAEAGYQVVINLGLLDPRYCLADEAALVLSLGLAYHHIPVQFDAPMVEDFRVFAAVMDQCDGRRVLVHCAANYRVTGFLALYGEMRLGWDRKRADDFARTLWPLNDTWAEFLATCREQVVGGADR